MSKCRACVGGAEGRAGVGAVRVGGCGRLRARRRNLPARAAVRSARAAVRSASPVVWTRCAEAAHPAAPPPARPSAPLTYLCTRDTYAVTHPRFLQTGTPGMRPGVLLFTAVDSSLSVC